MMWLRGIKFLLGAPLLLSGAAFMLLGCGPKKATETQPPKIEIRLYAIASATVDYEVSGIKTGIERLYFDSWGTRQARYVQTRMNILGLSQDENILKIVDGPWSYTIDMHKATGTREPNPLLKTYGNRIRRDGRLLLDDELMTDMGGRKGGSKKILGRKCQVWIVAETNTSYCLWKHLPLLTSVRHGDIELITKAVAIRENVPIKNDIFKIPGTLSITDATPAPTI